jgi:hypothetical protein
MAGMARIAILVVCVAAHSALAAEPTFTVKQLTRGPRHHYFGYIGHAGTIPFSGDNRYVLTLETTFHDRMPTAGDEAGIGLIDMHDANRPIEIVDRTRAWNPQQGTMFAWNPKQPNTQFFFNDRDPQSGRVFTVLYDTAERKRIAEYRFADVSIASGGVARQGDRFAAINYGRMARLRPVTGYAEAFDWTAGVDHPTDDGVFLVDTATREKTLLVSFAQLAEMLRDLGRDVDGIPLFINHTLWNRDGDRLFFFVRGAWTDRSRQINVPCVIRPDGLGLKPLAVHPGGHPEWDAGHVLIGNHGDKVVRYDVDRDAVIETLGTSAELGGAEGDKALSPDGTLLVNGWRKNEANAYTFLDRRTGEVLRCPTTFDVRGWTGGDLRIDPAPCWNRTGDAIVFPALTTDDPPTRQMFLIRIVQ